MDTLPYMVPECWCWIKFPLIWINTKKKEEEEKKKRSWFRGANLHVHKYPLSKTDKVCFRWPLAVEFNPLRWDVTGSRVKGREHNGQTRLLLCWRDENIHHPISALTLSWPQIWQSTFNVYSMCTVCRHSINTSANEWNLALADGVI